MFKHCYLLGQATVTPKILAIEFGGGARGMSSSCMCILALQTLYSLFRYFAKEDDGCNKMSSIFIGILSIL